MAHDITIILDGIECLQGAITGAGNLEEIKSKAIAADTFVKNSSEDEPEVHEWLENTQSALVSSCAVLSALNENCPELG